LRSYTFAEIIPDNYCDMCFCRSESLAPQIWMVPKSSTGKGNSQRTMALKPKILQIIILKQMQSLSKYKKWSITCSVPKPVEFRSSHLSEFQPPLGFVTLFTSNVAQRTKYCHLILYSSHLMFFSIRYNKLHIYLSALFIILSIGESICDWWQ
jgi:hypothetical protein